MKDTLEYILGTRQCLEEKKCSEHKHHQEMIRRQFLSCNYEVHHLNFYSILNKGKLHPVLIDDVDDGSNLAGIRALSDVDHAARLNKLGERLKPKIIRHVQFEKKP
jgi:hypothetical protein